MTFYPPEISRRFHSPKFSGELSEADATGVEANFTCGVSLRFFLKIEESEKKIASAGYTTNGCGYVIAIADFLAESVIGNKLTDLHGLEILEKRVAKSFGEIPAARIGCVNLCFDALQKALQEYRTVQIAEWTGEKALICTCFGVEEEMIENLIAGENLNTVEEVGDRSNAGTGCGSCQFLIQEMLDARDFR